MEENKSAEGFRPACSFNDDNSHVTVLTQSVVQDILCVHQAAEAIEARLPGDGEVSLRFRDEDGVGAERANDDSWSCAIIEHPASINEIAVNHPVGDYELVLSGAALGGTKFRPKAFTTRGAADNEKRRILLGSWNRLACTSRTPPRPTLSPSSLAPRRGPSKMTVWHCIALHRAVMRYKGFYDWMTGSGPSLRRLPSKNLFAVQHKAYADELLAELLPADRDRFRRYMSDRPLGIGIIAAAAGFGKTTVLATAGLSMEASLGSILVSGPTDVVVDNIARRLDRTSKEVCGRLNAGKTAGDRARHRMVVRGYNMRREVEAFINLWENPGYTPTGRKSKDPWQLYLASTERVSTPSTPTTRRPGTSSEIAVHQDIDTLMKCGKCPIPALAREVILLADFLCTIPAHMGNDGDYQQCMHRADIGCVWGNCLLPCIFGGDHRQLPPAVLSGAEKDADGNLRNRFADDGKISVMFALMASGLPVFRLLTQLRMADGLFDWVAKEFYSEVDFTYSTKCAVNLPKFQAGHHLERLVQTRYPGSVAPRPPGKLLPVFVLCNNAPVFLDGRTGSKKSPQQVKVAIDLAHDLLGMGVKPGQITIISPYAANVDLVRRLLRNDPRYSALKAMGKPATVDSFQGQENDIIIVVMGTRFSHPGPGFNTDQFRLNVPLTRQRRGLAVVGDVDIRGTAGKGRGQGKKGGETPFHVITPTGEKKWVTAPLLQRIYRAFTENRRVVRVDEWISGPRSGQTGEARMSWLTRRFFVV
ncbi:hypothetical protein N658DRAFT_561957 [Parathielavia hyrcaniae]|uniref:DNA2/NAM7 helicase-like C-terminal domain-containing protein n=1 Tax=Parathielavia hyrcaniae TaxID=113614 RepID=A0AAN6PW36_9PEZI|nr:hypothetical protein N658DRAFT_561957 [Parathielavia hyrcaniae]